VRSLDVTFTPRTRSHRQRRIAALVVVLGVLAAAWFFLAPPGIGGDTTYVVTDGTSMHPRIHTGDLALVRPAASYHVGDIVAYRNPELHVVVLHRIHSISAGGRYRFKGDNNSWIDPGSVYHKDVFAQDKKFVFFCAGGLRSALAAQTAQRMGLKPVAHIRGGFGAWKKAGAPVEEPAPR